MIYRYYRDVENLSPGTKLWACACDFDNNKITMGLISKLIYGMLRGWAIEMKKGSIYIHHFLYHSEKEAKQNLKNKSSSYLFQSLR